VQNAFRYLEAQHLAATDSRTGLGSASAFEDGAAAGDQRGPAARAPAVPDPDRSRQLRRHQQANGIPRYRQRRADEFGERVRQLIRGSDTAFRNSGGADEFFLILPETTREEATLLYRRLEFEMATPRSRRSTLR
jgi:GGDEF domain-containing protein